MDTAPEPVDGWFTGYAGANSGGGDYIMTAGMAELGQGVIFRQNGDSRFPLSVAPSKSGG